MDEQTYNISFRCFFNGDPSRYSTHFQRDFPLKDIPRWLDAYRFTHPECTSISCKVWFAGAVNEKRRLKRGEKMITVGDLHSLSPQSFIFIRREDGRLEEFTGNAALRDAAVGRVTAKSYPMFKRVLEIELAKTGR